MIQSLEFERPRPHAFHRSSSRRLAQYVIGFLDPLFAMIKLQITLSCLDLERTIKTQRREAQKMGYIKKQTLA